MNDAILQADIASELVLFRDGHASLRIERGTDDTFELVLCVDGEEVTAYDLTPEAVSAIGRKLLNAAAHANATAPPASEASAFRRQ